MVRIGLVGIGFMGMMHFQAAKRIRNGKVTAIATRDPKKLAGDWTSIRGNFGPAGQQEDLSGVKKYSDWRELVADPEIDFIDICLPNDQHAETATAALKAGKHVLVEKPIAMSVADADAMIAAASAAGRSLQVAHVLPFFAEFRFAMNAVQDGRYGKLLAAHLRRHISPPDWSTAIADAERTGGPIIDLHIHDTHFVGLLAGRPLSVQSIGTVRNGIVEYVLTHYVYEKGGPIVTASSGAISHPSRPFTHGYELFLEKATIYYEAGARVQLYSSEGVTNPTFDETDPVDTFAAELSAALAVASGAAAAPHLSASLARDALALCYAEAESVKTGKPTAID